jgi:hypothetical protein
VDVTLRSLARSDIPAWADLLAAIEKVDRTGEHYAAADLGAWARNTRGGVLRRVCDGWDTWICLRIKVMRACSR